MNVALAESITLVELWIAISKGKPNKARGIDRICLEFYKIAWDAIKLDLLHIINCMILNGAIMTKGLQGHIVCITKKAHSKKIEDYRPLT